MICACGALTAAKGWEAKPNASQQREGASLRLFGGANTSSCGGLRRCAPPMPLRQCRRWPPQSAESCWPARRIAGPSLLGDLVPCSTIAMCRKQHRRGRHGLFMPMWGLWPLYAHVGLPLNGNDGQRMLACCLCSSLVACSIRERACSWEARARRQVRMAAVAAAQAAL